MKSSKISCSRALASTAMILMLLSIAGGAAPFAYITNQGSNNVSVIDIATNNVTANVTVGSSPFGVAVNPDGTKVYIANRLSGTVSVIDAATNNVTANVPVGSAPIGVAVNPDGTKVYVTSLGNSTVSVIDTATNNVTASVPVGSAPFGVAVNPDGTKVYVANIGSDTVSIIDTTTNNVTINVPVGSTPFGVAVTPDGKKAYIANLGSNTVSVIDAATNNVTANVPVGFAPIGVAANPAGTKVYVTNLGSSTVSVIDTATNAVTASVHVIGPFGVSVTQDGTKVYVANLNSNTVSVIDTATNNVTATVPVGKQPVAFGQFIVPSLPVLTINKYASPTNYSAIGQNITYTYNVTNSGNVNIRGPITVTDNRTGTTQISSSDLAPGQSVTGTANYTITQADLNAGSVTNAAFATGTFNGTEIKSTNSTSIVTAVQSPALITVKLATPTIYFTIGQVITYTYNVTNSGNVNIRGPITVTDNRTGTTQISSSDLAPGQSVTGTANYTITQADITNGSVTNAVFATGTFNTVITSANATATVTAIQNPALITIKLGAPVTYSTIGQNLTYTYIAVNSGNVNILGPINITDNRTGTTQISSSDLAPGQYVLGTANYTITQADIDNGSVTNAAFATGTFNGIEIKSANATATVTAI
jgi:YVTN family beta-propeller protein